MFEADTIKREHVMTAHLFSLFCLNQVVALSAKPQLEAINPVVSAVGPFLSRLP
jgi:hypothetical protein